MTPSDFFRRLLSHITLALGVWLVAALVLERLVPGFVTPFVNVPGMVLVFSVLVAAALPLMAGGNVSMANKVVSILLIALLTVVLCLFLWTRLAGLGGLRLLLSGAAFVGCVLLLVSFWSTPSSS